MTGLMLLFVILMVNLCYGFIGRPSTRIIKKYATTSPSEDISTTNPLSFLEDLDLPDIIDRVIKPVQFMSEDSTRVRYIMPMVVRVGFFLGQGVTLSAAGIDRPAVDSEETTATKLNPVSVIGALQDAFFADDIDILAQPDADLADELASRVSDDDLQRNLFAKNFGKCISQLYK